MPKNAGFFGGVLVKSIETAFLRADELSPKQPDAKALYILALVRQRPRKQFDEGNGRIVELHATHPELLVVYEASAWNQLTSPFANRETATRGIEEFIKWAGLVKLNADTFVSLGDLSSKPVLLSLLGLVVMIVLMARGFKGGILVGIIVAAIVGYFMGIVRNPGQFVSLPPSIAPTLFKLDLVGAVKNNLFAVIFIFFFLDLFDTVGSLIGIAKHAGLMKDGKLHPLKIVIYDDASDETKAVLAAKKLIDEDKVTAIVGTTLSGTSLAILDTVQKAEVPLVSCAAAMISSRSIATPDRSPRWRTKARPGRTRSRTPRRSSRGCRASSG